MNLFILRQINNLDHYFGKSFGSIIYLVFNNTSCDCPYVAMISPMLNDL